ncbi:ATP-dependent DNA helicase II subunit 2 [Trichodelitschia bisporula]|uniref:ATP-dependent DNA helicase II subunit 2 n=1 Tax=Trichodelitschia bisporula TaxID=703511 RepID=A0A6G1I676_9PEZI|nr:ATP-dependent DNA helicase II subunit 2 [Trichodelitschia bisporula]
MATPKEATVFVLDISPSMGSTHHGRSETDLTWAMSYVWERITAVVETERKTLEIGVLAVKADETQHMLGEMEGYEGIVEVHPVKQVLMEGLAHIRETIWPSSTQNGDIFSALVVAVSMITKHCGKRKYGEKVVTLITNGRGEMDDDDMASLAKKINKEGIRLNIIGVDFDDPDFGYKEESKPAQKAQNEASLRQLAQSVEKGSFRTLASAIANLANPIPKAKGAAVNFRGVLRLGNSDVYDDALMIEIERYLRTTAAPAPTASSVVVKGKGTQGGSLASSATVESAGVSAVTNARTYTIQDPDAPGGKRDVERDDLAKGYTYGRTAVPIEGSDENVVKLDTMPVYDLVGFIAAEKHPRYLNMTNSNLLIPQRGNDKAALALSSLIRALDELKLYAVARFVKRAGADPRMVLLAPFFEQGFEGLVDVELPFAEDVRSYTFPPLDRVVTVKGETLAQHRNLPDVMLMKAMGAYIDGMDLSEFGTGPDGRPGEYATVYETFSMKAHRLSHAIRTRVADPQAPLPPPLPVLTRFAHPPEELLAKNKGVLERVIQAANVKKVPPKAKLRGGRNRAPPEKPLSGLDVDALLRSGSAEPRRGISASNAIPEFKQLLERTEDLDGVRDVVRQFGEVAEGYVRDSTGDSGYARAIEALRVMREKVEEFEEPGIWNTWITGFNKKLAGGDLGGDRREMVYLLKVNRLGELEEGVETGEKEADGEEAEGEETEDEL